MPDCEVIVIVMFALVPFVIAVDVITTLLVPPAGITTPGFDVKSVPVEVAWITQSLFCTA